MAARWFDGTYYKREITLNYMDCNTEKKVFLHCLLGLFAEIAADEAQSKGQTHEFLANSGKVFLITRMSVRLHKTPRCNETLTFKTWFRTTDGKFFLRDFDVKSPHGELIASASSTWVMIDPIEHKVIEPSEYNYDYSKFVEKRSDSPDCKKIVPEVPLPVIGNRPVYYSDLDCNYHVNNSSYSRIATDFLPPEYQSRDVEEYVVNFNKETRLDETLEIRGGAIEDGYIIQGYCDNVLHFGCEFLFRK